MFNDCDVLFLIDTPPRCPSTFLLTPPPPPPPPPRHFPTRTQYPPPILFVCCYLNWHLEAGQLEVAASSISRWSHDTNAALSFPSGACARLTTFVLFFICLSAQHLYLQDSYYITYTDLCDSSRLSYDYASLFPKPDPFPPGKQQCRAPATPSISVKKSPKTSHLV